MSEPTTIAVTPPRRPIWRVLLLGAMIGIALANTVEITRMIFFRNRHIVLAGRVYRSSQLKPAELEKMVNDYGIRTVINLRGRFPDEVYINQSKVIQQLEISQEDVTSSANRLPSPMEIRRLIEIFDQCEYPILLHCKQGADRTGLAAALYQMIYTDADYAEARRQCDVRFGHFPVMTTVAMDRFFDQYEEWLSDRNLAHGSENCREWATKYYAPGLYTARLEILFAPKRVRQGSTAIIRIRATNTSTQSWHMKAGNGVGVHVRYLVFQPNGKIYDGRAGMFDREVPPGESVEIDLPIPPHTEPGAYSLRADLSFRLNEFAHFGSEPVTYDWVTRGKDAAKPQ